MQHDLQPCQCGNDEPTIDRYDVGARLYFVECRRCYRCSETCETEAEAIAAWNHRPTPAGDAILCIGCEGNPAAENNPCAVCGKSAPAGDAVALSAVLARSFCENVDDWMTSKLDDSEMGEILARAAIAAMGGSTMKPADIIEAIQRMFERGRATLDKDGYLVAIPPAMGGAGWRPIETAPDLDRIWVAGWQAAHGGTRGYWWYHEGSAKNGKSLEPYAGASLWAPLNLPPLPPTPETQND